MQTWSTSELAAIAGAEELEITTARTDGTLRRWVPIWVVRVDDRVYVRTWHRRDTGWFGRAVGSGRARVRVPGVETDVVVLDIAGTDIGLRQAVDAAYRVKYGRHGSHSVEQMITSDAVASTLCLERVPERQDG